MPAIRRLRAIVAAASLTALPACAPSTRPQTPTAMTAAGVQLPADRVQVEVNDASSRFTIGIERTSQFIIDSTDDPEIRKRAMLWRYFGTLAAQDAAFRFDPFVSALDLYALAAQQQQFFAEGPGKDAFGPFQPLVIKRTTAATQEMRQYLTRVLPGPKLDTILTVVDAWVDSHPIQDEFFGRPTVEGVAARAIKADETSIFSAVGDVQHTLRSVDDRIALLQQTIAKQIGWQAEYLANEALSSRRMDSLLAVGYQLSGAADRLSRVAESAPELVTGERKAVLDALHAEQVAVMTGIGRERAMVLAAITLERQAALADINRQRMAVEVDAERAGMRIVDHAAVQFGGVADQLIRKIALEIVLPLALGLAVFAFVLVRMLGPRRAGTTP